MTDIILAVLGLVATVLASVAVFRGGNADRIDRKRESELTRLDKRLTAVESDLGLVATVAWRAVRFIEKLGSAQFDVTDEEREALERTRPI